MAVGGAAEPHDERRPPSKYRPNAAQMPPKASPFVPGIKLNFLAAAEVTAELGFRLVMVVVWRWRRVADASQGGESVDDVAGGHDDWDDEDGQLL